MTKFIRLARVLCNFVVQCYSLPVLDVITFFTSRKKAGKNNVVFLCSGFIDHGGDVVFCNVMFVRVTWGGHKTLTLGLYDLFS